MDGKWYAVLVLAMVAAGGGVWAAQTLYDGGQTSLSPEELEGLLWAREEEKLARDVYLTLYETWGLEIFANIAESEQRHMDAVLRLLEAYGLEDPAQDEIGVFTNPDLQALYDQLVEIGTRSPEDAILVGALIEETDIVDLQRIIDSTDKADIITTLENLIAGSKNHLRAFAAQYENLTGEPYKAQVLPEEVVAEILSGA